MKENMTTSPYSLSPAFSHSAPNNLMPATLAPHTSHEMTTVQVRFATFGDIEPIQAFADVIYSAQFSDEAQKKRFLERMYSEKSLQRSIANQGTGYYVAYADDTLVGLTHFGSPLMDECTDRKEVHRLFVHPHYTRRSIGGQLLGAMTQHYKNDPDVQKFFVYIQNDSVREAFFGKYGFIHHPDQDKDDERYFVKIL
jgi:N-acetylglutamate synthase-like GNAT family acetyltransferase